MTALTLRARIKPGLIGPPVSLTVGSVTALGVNADPTVEISGDPPNQSLAFGIPQGRRGPAAGFVQAYDAGSTADSDPGAGKFKLNHATPSSATAAYLDNADIDGVTVSGIVDLFDDSTSTVKGILRIQDEDDPTSWAEYQITGSVVDGTGYRKLTLQNGVSSNDLTDANTFAISFYRTGDKGTTGDVGSRGPIAAQAYTFSTTTTDSDPGSGALRFNNATPASVTAIYVDNNEAGGADVSAWLDTLDDNGDSSSRGMLEIFDAADATKFQIFRVTGSVVDGTGYRKLSVTRIAGVATVFSNAASLGVTFSARGPAGTGDVSASVNFGTDNVIVRSDGVNKNIQATGISVDDSNNLSGVAGISNTGAFTLSGIISPAQITADQDNYAPTGYATATVFRLSSGASRNITGFAAGSAGQVVIWHNVGAQNIVLKDESASSTAANRFALTADLTLAADAVAILQYDGTSSRWRAVGGGSVFAGDSGSGGAAGLVPAPAAGDAAAGKVLGAAGTWVSQTAQAGNVLINGEFVVNQRAAASNADDTYCFDRWNVLTQTGTIAASALTNIEDGTPFGMRVTQSQASAQRFGVEQIIEGVNCKHLRGQAVTLSARVRMSASTTLRFAILEWTGTLDAVTSDVVNDWTSGTFTAGNFFLGSNLTVTATGSQALTANTLTNISLSGTCGSSLNNLIVLFWTDSTQAQNVTLDVTKAKLEKGSAATAFVWDDYALLFSKCARYGRLLSVTAMGRAESTTLISLPISFVFPMRTAPSGAIQGTIKARDYSAANTRTASSPSLNAVAVSSAGGFIEITASSWSPANFTASNFCSLNSDDGNGVMLSAEL